MSLIDGLQTFLSGIKLPNGASAGAVLTAADNSGTAVWATPAPATSAPPIVMAPGTTYSVPANSQALYVVPIQVTAGSRIQVGAGSRLVSVQ